MTKNLKKLTILHSNDLHGDFKSEKIDDKLVGGVSLLSGYISDVKKKEENVLYCIAGDMFTGSIIDSEFKGISTIEIMNMLAPDIVTVGNHEVDYGVAHLLFVEKMAKFPIINANLYIRSNHAHLFQGHKIIEIGGMKILFIGVITEQVLSQTRNDELVGSFIDIEEAAKEVERICDAYNAIDVDLTILLTHIGYEEDQKLAALLDKNCGVDIIIGGHTHTLPEKAIEVNGIQIVQAGIGTDQIGRFDILVDTDKNCIDSFTWKTVPITDENCPKDESIENIINGYIEQTEKKYSRIITRLKRELSHPCRDKETELGNLFCDALKESFGVDIVLIGSGSVRSEKMGPIITYTDLMQGYPYVNSMHMVYLKGKQLKHIFEFLWRDEVWNDGHASFLQVSKGLHIVYNRTSSEFETFDFEGKPVDDDALYKVAIQRYAFISMKTKYDLDQLEVLSNGPQRTLCTSDYDVIEEYLSTRNNLDSVVEGRMIIK